MTSRMRAYIIERQEDDWGRLLDAARRGVQACKPEPVAHAVVKGGKHVSDGCIHPDPLGAEDCAAQIRLANNGDEPRIVPLYAGVGPATTSNEGSQDG